MIRLTLALILLATPAEACHRFSVWQYPYPQRCRVEVSPPPKPPPLPALDQWIDPPDAPGELGERLKGIGLLRQLRGTN
jgi:hypothetical protein